MDQLPAIAVLGRSGELGSALARRWAQAGYVVIIGSRTADRAIEAAALIGQQVRGAENVEAAEAAEVIVVAVPYSNHAHILEAIRQTASGKIVVDVVVPLVPPKVSVVQIPQGGSAALEAKAILGADVKVVSAFHNVGAAKLHAGGKVDCDVLVRRRQHGARLGDHTGGSRRNARHRWRSFGQLRCSRGADVCSDRH